MKILVVEDEAELLGSIVENLEKEKYIVESAGTFAAALDKLSGYDYSCILLDIGLPGGSGLTLLKQLRESGKSDSVIVISARHSLDDKIAGLELGADDYLTKPFHLAELNARIRAVLRRKSFEGQNVITHGNISVHFQERSVYVAGQEVPLNRKEYDLLSYFLANRNRLVSKSSIISHVWGDETSDADSFELIYSQIRNLRRKLRDHAADIEIQAVYGVGYKLMAAP